jgi:hypothetical protein
MLGGEQGQNMQKRVLTLAVTAAFIVGAAGVGLLSTTNGIEAAAFTLLISGQFLGAIFMIAKRQELYPDSQSRRGPSPIADSAVDNAATSPRAADRAALPAS